MVGVIIIVSWSLVLSLSVLFPLRVLGMLRLSDNFQDKGADVMEHSPCKAYNSASSQENATA